VGNRKSLWLRALTVGVIRDAGWSGSDCFNPPPSGPTTDKMRPSMTFPDILPALSAQTPNLRGRLLPNQPLAEFTWFRVGGPAQVVFMPEDEQDLSYFLAQLPSDIPVTVIGLGSNLIVRDGGVPGVVIRLGRGFSNVSTEEGARIRVGAAVPDV